MTALVPAGVALAGVGAAVWASTVEDGAPGWRSGVATLLVLLGTGWFLAEVAAS